MNEPTSTPASTRAGQTPGGSAGPGEAGLAGGSAVPRGSGGPRGLLSRRPLLRDAAFVYAVALTVRLLALLEVQRSVFARVLVGDARQYDTWARSIAGGDWLGSGVFYQAPLYPYFLGVLYTVTGPHPLAARLVQIAIGAFACVLVLLAGRRVFDARTGLIAGLLLAVYAPAVFFDLLIQKTVLDTALMALLLALLAATLDRPRTSLFAAAGLALGAVSLTRENAILLLPWVLVWILVHFRGLFQGSIRGEPRVPWRWSVAFAAGVLALLLPVAARNQIVGGEFALTTAQFGPNLYIGNNPYTDGRYVPLREGRADARYERQDAVELAEEALGRKLSPAGVSAFWTGQVLEYVRSKPGEWLRLITRKTLLFWNAGEVVDTEGIEAYREQSLVLRGLSTIFHFGWIVPLAVLGAALTWRRRERLWVFYGMVLVMAASVILFFVLARYRHPMAPVLVLFAAAGLRHLAFPHPGESRRSRAVVTAVVLAVVAALAVNRPFPHSASQRALAYYSVGDALIEAGRSLEAIAPLQEAIRSKPDFPAAWLHLSTALDETGHRTEAIVALERALPSGHGEWIGPGEVDPAASADPDDVAEVLSRLGSLRFQGGNFAGALAAYGRLTTLQPERAGAHSDLGATLLHMGRFAQAVPPLQRAVALDPNLGLARLNLGLALFRLGDADEAAAHLDAAVRLEPENAGVYLVRGMVREARGMMAEAADDYRRALVIQPDQVEARTRLEGLR